jgi:hypothetical protein
MRFQTPASLMNLIYFGMDTRALASIGDELLGLGLGRLYLGLYPTAHGIEVCWGLTDANGCL